MGEAVFQLRRVPVLIDYKNAFVAADLNLPLDSDEKPILGALRDGYYDGLEQLGFFAWLGCQHL